MHDNYTFRRGISPKDAEKLRDLFTPIFHPEEVGVLAETFFNHLPGRDYRYWFLMEEKESSVPVSAFTLIPWTWMLEGIGLKVAEQGIVGTLEAHRRKGLMRTLNAEFDATVREEGFDLSIIQGIPGFYCNFGYYYAVELENHINLPLHVLPGEDAGSRFAFRMAGMDDIPYLMDEENAYREAYFIASRRSEELWRFIFTDALRTELASEFWIMEDRAHDERFYFRISLHGFGTGLIISEASEGITWPAFEGLLSFAGKLAVERGKPYVRINLPNASRVGGMAIEMGAVPGMPYAWQVKIADPARLLARLAPVLESRIAESRFRGLTGTVRIDLYRSRHDLVWDGGRLMSISPPGGEVRHTMSVGSDCFPALVLGYRSWKELRHNRPDVFPSSPETGDLVNVLFPKKISWIYCQY